MYSGIACKECGKSHHIQNKTLHLCSQCVYKRNHNGKTEFEVRVEKQKEKEKKGLIKTKSSKPKPKKETGELKMFHEIWEERPHICVHCGAKLYNFSVWNFEHIKPKSTHPELRLVKENIELLCSECHFCKTNCSRDIYNKRKGINI